jgi:hypothetical protein
MFAHQAGHVTIVIGTVAAGQIGVRVLLLRSVSYHSTDESQSFIYYQEITMGPVVVSVPRRYLISPQQETRVKQAIAQWFATFLSP